MQGNVQLTVAGGPASTLYLDNCAIFARETATASVQAGGSEPHVAGRGGSQTHVDAAG